MCKNMKPTARSVTAEKFIELEEKMSKAIESQRSRFSVLSPVQCIEP